MINLLGKRKNALVTSSENLQDEQYQYNYIQPHYTTNVMVGHHLNPDLS